MAATPDGWSDEETGDPISADRRNLYKVKGLNASVEEIEIVFIEVKTGRSALSARERAVKKAVEEKKVSWRVFNPDVEVDRQRIPIITESSPMGVQA